MRICDGHCDTILRCYTQGGDLLRRTGHLDLERMGRYGGYVQFFALFGSREEFPGRPLYPVFQEEYAVFHQNMTTHAALVEHCRTGAEADAALKKGKCAAFLSVEGAELLDCDLQKLQRAYDLGVRAVNLTWNYENALSGSNAEGADKGLTDQGRAFVEKMQELGMLVDVSHLSDPGFWDVIALAKKPVFASHSNARSLCPHKRNLTDEQFTAIINDHGVAGLNMCHEFLGREPDLDTAIAHIEHWCALGGEKNVSLGGDWDGIARPPKGVRGIQDLEALAERLLRMNYPEDRVEDIFFNNLMRVVREVCTM